MFEGNKCCKSWKSKKDVTGDIMLWGLESDLLITATNRWEDKTFFKLIHIFGLHFIVNTGDILMGAKSQQTEGLKTFLYFSNILKLILLLKYKLNSIRVFCKWHLETMKQIWFREMKPSTNTLINYCWPLKN